MRALRTLIGIALVGTAIHGNAAIVNGTELGTTETANFSDFGFVGQEQIISNSDLIATGTVPLFDISGAVLLSYRVVGELWVTTEGFFGTGAAGSWGASIGASSVLAGDINAGNLADSDGPLFTGEAVATSEFNIQMLSAATSSSLIGPGTLAVSGTGFTGLVGSCLNDNNDCSETPWNHIGSAELRFLRVEWTYCTTPGEDGCPDAIAGVNTPGVIAVSEPATIALLGLALGGLAFVRRRTSARRTA